MSSFRLDQVLCRDSKLLTEVPDGIVDTVISSFAWEDQVDYGGDPENLGRFAGDAFIEKAVEHLAAAVPKVRQSGNIFIELQSAIRDGRSSLAEEKFTIAAVEQCGLVLVQKLYSIRTNAEPLAPQNRLRRGVVPIFHFVRDPRLYQVFKDHVRKPSAWASKDSRPKKYHPDGKDPGDLIWSRQDLLTGAGPDYAALNAAGEASNFVACPKAQNHADLGHPAIMADAIAEFLVLYGTAVGGTVMDVMAGTGTTLLAAKKHGRRFLGIEINPEYAATARQRLGIGQADQEEHHMESKIMTHVQVARYIGRTEGAVKMLVKRKKIPFGRHQDGRVVFDRDAIDAWLKNTIVWVAPGTSAPGRPATTPAALP